MKKIFLMILIGASCLISFSANSAPPVYERTELHDVGWPVTVFADYQTIEIPLLPVQGIPVMESRYVKRSFLGHNKKQNRYLMQKYGKPDKERSIALETHTEDLPTDKEHKPPAWQLEESKVKDQE